MLGTIAYLGISWTTNGYTNSMVNIYRTYNFQDIETQYPYGINGYDK